VLLLAEIMSPRTLILHAPLMIFAALGVDAVARVSLSAERPSWLKHSALVITACLCTVQTVYYFSSHLPTFIRQMYTVQPWQQIIFDVRLLPQNAHVHLVTPFKLDQLYLYYAVRFMTDYDDLALSTYTPDDITPTLLGGLNRDQPQAFIVQMPNAPVDTLLRQFYPEIMGPFLDHEWAVADPWFAYYVLPEER
jgi:hypothetical protein